jgi:putative intracellular protease/amidase
MEKTIALYVFDTLADWETGFLVAELHSGRYFKKEVSAFKLQTVSINNQAVVTMGGIKIVPDISVDELKVEHCAMLILPGGNTWQDPIHNPVLEKAREFLLKGSLVAAICGATFGLARMGMLDNYRHTSNNLGFLKVTCPEYKGEKNYMDEPAVSDGTLITATGIAPLEFAFQALKVLQVFSESTLEAWYNLYKTKNSQYFYRLMDAVQNQ